ncbi:MAG: von Willebrand factor type A domain-containing protein [Acidobacteria bacterium]|nr:von Willebrand factor type A domain-containing protein [Acidobacteriota bacterium]
MTDPLDDLKRAFERSTPEPDTERRKANLARAQEVFDRVQGVDAEQRRTDDRTHTWAGIEQGVRHMLKALTSRPVLATAGVVAAVGLTVLLVTATRDETPRSSVVVADAGVAPAPVPETPAPPEREETDPGPPPSKVMAAADGDDPDEAGGSTVGGRVVDDEGEPVPGVSVTLSGASGERFGLTDNSGSYRFPDVAPGDYSVKVALEGMGEADAAVRAAAGDRRSVDFTLQAAIREETVTGMSPVTVTAEARAEDDWSALASRPGRTAAPPPAAEPPVVAESAVRESRMRVAAWSAAEPPPPEAVSPPVDVRIARPTRTEAFANEPASPVKVAGEEPVSTFSIDVDTASYSVVRSSLMNGYLPSPESVRIEELVNYFPYAYPAPGERGAPFRPTVTVSETPWNPDTLLMHIGIQGRQPEADDRPPVNLVFLIDTSGSMNQPNKLPLLVQSFRLMLGQLDRADEVAIVTYAGSAGLALDATASSDRGAILAALDRLRASGSTAGAAGVQLAYQTAAGMAADGEVTRVILATDGDFNVGISDPEELDDFIARQRDSGIYLSVLGFGRGNLDDATMQALAQSGNGQAAYIDTLSEAQKVLVDQLTGTLFPIADDVKIQVEFNPAAVAEYRLIGYETRSLRREDFNNDRVDAGEIGAGHSVTAIYEVTPAGSPAVLHDALRYADRVAEPPGAAGERRAGELAFLRLRYKEPGEDASRLIELPIVRDAGRGGSEQGFAAAIAGFGQLLRGSVYTGSWTFADAIALAEANTGDDRFGYRREAVTLMRLAESLFR